MFNKIIADSIRQSFDDKFSKISENDKEILNSTQKILDIVGNECRLTDNKMNALEDAITEVICAASIIGYFIGIKDGADVISSITKETFPEYLLRL